MFIIKWVTSKNEIYYKSLKYLNYDYYIGYKNQFNHEILEIFYVYNNKLWTYEEYLNRQCFKTKSNIFKKIVHTLNKLNK